MSTTVGIVMGVLAVFILGQAIGFCVGLYMYDDRKKKLKGE